MIQTLSPNPHNRKSSPASQPGLFLGRAGPVLGGCPAARGRGRRFPGSPSPGLASSASFLHPELEAIGPRRKGPMPSFPPSVGSPQLAGLALAAGGGGSLSSILQSLSPRPDLF